MRYCPMQLCKSSQDVLSTIQPVGRADSYSSDHLGLARRRVNRCAKSGAHGSPNKFANKFNTEAWRLRRKFSTLPFCTRAFLAMSVEATSWFRSPSRTLMVSCRRLRFTKDLFIDVPTFWSGLKPDVSKLRHVPVSVIGKEHDLCQAKRLAKWPAFLLRSFWYFGMTRV